MLCVTKKFQEFNYKFSFPYFLPVQGSLFTVFLSVFLSFFSGNKFDWINVMKQQQQQLVLLLQKLYEHLFYGQYFNGK